MKRKMKARLAVYEFLFGFSTVMENPQEDIPQTITQERYPELSPEDIADAAEFVSGQIIRKINHYRDKI